MVDTPAERSRRYYHKNEVYRQARRKESKAKNRALAQLRQKYRSEYYALLYAARLEVEREEAESKSAQRVSE